MAAHRHHRLRANQEVRDRAEPRERPARQHVRPPTGGSEEGGEEGGESQGASRPQSSAISQLLTALIRGQVVRQVRHVTGLFTGEQQIARVLTGSNAFGTAVITAADKLGNIVQGTFGGTGGEWVKNIGREVAAAFKRGGNNYRGGNGGRSDPGEMRPMADESPSIKPSADPSSPPIVNAVKPTEPPTVTARQATIRAHQQLPGCLTHRRPRIRRIIPVPVLAPACRLWPALA